MDRSRPLLDPDDDRRAAAPDRRRYRAADLLRQRRQLGDRQPNRIDLLQADQPELDRQRPQAVVAADRILLDQAELLSQVAGGLSQRLGARPAAKG